MQHILSLSYGKDSLACLGAIELLGWPLDRIAHAKKGEKQENMTQDKKNIMQGFVDGNTSDGYHTFNELYHHRAILFSVIVNLLPDISWKSKKHHDGTMYKDMFIVGIETPHGQATYHYDVSPYWDLFKCRELERAPEWDGHTSNDAIERIKNLCGC